MVTVDLSNPRIFTAVLKAEGLPMPVFEHPFHSTRRWRLDAAWPDLKIAVEFEGLLWGEGGRHQRPAGYAEDCRKYNELQTMGWQVYRFSQQMHGEVIPVLKKAIALRKSI